MTAQHCVDEGSAGAAVPVREGMDGLKLGMGDRGLAEQWEVRPLGERDEIGHQGGHMVGMRRDERGIVRSE